MPELVGVKAYQADEFKESRVDDGARVSERSAQLRRGRPQQVAPAGENKINAPGWESPRAGFAGAS